MSWKAAERRIAELLGAKRVPVSGRARGDAPDVTSPWLSVEVKHWTRGIPAYLEDAMRQAEASANPEQLPLAVLHVVGQQYERSFVVLRLSDFRDWFGGTR